MDDKYEKLRKQLKKERKWAKETFEKAPTDVNRGTAVTYDSVLKTMDFIDENE